MNDVKLAFPGARIGDTDAALRRNPGQVTTASKVLIPLFLVSLIILFSFNIGDLRLTPHRLFLIVITVPVLVQWALGQCGKVKAADIFVLIYAAWVFLTYMINQGLSQLPNAGMTVVETTGPYFLARRYIHDRRSFLILAKSLFVIMVIFSATVAFEALAGFRLYEKLLSLVGQANTLRVEIRMGMIRSSGPFEHPILYGVFCSAAFSILYHMPAGRKGTRAGLRRAWASAVATLFSLSMGAFLNVIVQCALIAWNAVFRWLKGRWWLLLFLVIAAYVLVDLLSNRTPFEVFISYATFDYGNAYMRVIIFIEGMVSVKANPLFGFGNCCWERPAWMWSIPSVDNFWLLVAMRHGIPGFILIVAVWLSVIFALARAKPHDRIDADLRLGLAYVLIGVAVSIATVHIWGPTYGLVMLLLGSGAWISDLQSKPSTTEELLAPPAPEARRMVFSRFQNEPSSGGSSPRASTAPAPLANSAFGRADERFKGSKYGRVKLGSSEDGDQE